MDGKGRCFDNIWIERFWRSLKWEDIYLKEYGNVEELLVGLTAYFDKYNQRRPHQSLNYRTPAAVYFEQRNIKKQNLNSTLFISDTEDYI